MTISDSWALTRISSCEASALSAVLELWQLGPLGHTVVLGWLLPFTVVCMEYGMLKSGFPYMQALTLILSQCCEDLCSVRVSAE